MRGTKYTIKDIRDLRRNIVFFLPPTDHHHLHLSKILVRSHNYIRACDDYKHGVPCPTMW